MARFEIDVDYLVRTLVDLLNTPSPSGDTEWASGFVQQEFEALGAVTRRTRKGAVLVTLEGLKNDKPRAITAHIDTLGMVVSRIKPNGRLQMSAIGGIMWPNVDGEGVTIATRSEGRVRGSIVLENGAAHVNREAHRAVRTADNLEVRLYERTGSAEETRLLGIEVGDFVYLDPRTEVSDSGFIRSRFLDDKASVACVLSSVKALQNGSITPAQETTILISNFEEVGHGGVDGLPPDIHDLLVVDMACIGEGLQGTEFNCSLCYKDSGGPYSRELTERLRASAERRGITLKPDVYPFYSSDGTAYWRGGGSAQVALIGPGVDYSHAYERTHKDALTDTAQLIAEFLVED